MPGHETKGRTRAAVARGAGFLAFWVVLIGLDPVDLAVGACAAAAATWTSLRLLPPEAGRVRFAELAALLVTEHRGERFEFAGNASNTELDATALLLHEGYTVGYTEMEMELDPFAPLPEYPLPPGFEVRPALPEHIPLIAESIAEANRNEFPKDRFRNQHMEAAKQAEWHSDPVFDRTLWQVAWDGDQIAGLVLPMIEQGRAAFNELIVRPAWRRRGLARALMTLALHDLRSRGIKVIRIATWAEFSTRAIDLYTSLGFRVVKEFRRYRKPP